jgi:sugar transferase (PEP-CTERM/EpsH1 system associated)
MRIAMRADLHAAARAPSDPRPLIAHVLFRFDVGGLENGVVNLINRLPAHKWRHAVIALDEVVPAFAARLARDDVNLLSLHKPAGHLWPMYPRVARVLRELRPAIVHTRNLAALEAAVPAWWAGVPVRLHGEHGWDAHDVEGASPRYRRVRKLFRPFVHRYIALSDQIAGYLDRRVGIGASRITRIYNGVDLARFAPRGAGASRAALPFSGDDVFVIGCVGRMQAVKDHLTLVRAFISLAAQHAAARLVIVGDGPTRAAALEALRNAGLADRAWLPGTRNDVPELMRSFDVFVLPSLSEGISNTILEAMAVGLPVVATRVGGNPELVEDGTTGRLVPSSDPAALALALAGYLSSPESALAHGAAGRRRVESRFSLDAMVAAYDAVYEQSLAAARGATALAPAGN